ncbi:MAG: hypothetical protein M0R46_12590 [Candidatus Muirbacterium halophilum]|nr:hypothetical protein [Candidatus Muirbacterium halophilum]MCK9476755.1 hypothetical protein [Candidatus Muirbacterium halophilum]
MLKSNLVWSSEDGDIRKKQKNNNQIPITKSDFSKNIIHLRRLTAGKGRTVIEISNLPDNADWCKELAKDIKKSIGVAGTYKNNIIEIHTEDIEKISVIFAKKQIKWKKIGG